MFGEDEGGRKSGRGTRMSMGPEASAPGPHDNTDPLSPRTGLPVGKNPFRGKVTAELYLV